MTPLPTSISRLLSVLALLILLGATPTAGQGTAAPCESQSFEGSNYVVCSVDPKGQELRLFWKDAAGRPYRHFSDIAEAVAGEGERLVLAVNAGMYDEAFAPIGLYVEEGRELRALNATKMTGSPGQVPNFYKRPNGVFLIDGTGAGILTTDAYREMGGEGARLATQSGPMLVIGGKLHPALIPGSSDRTRRSGVGVCASGTVRFAISEGSVNFHDFARLFRDELKCPDALFLDGGRGVGLYEPGLGRNDWSWHGGYGPIFGLVERPGGD
jgi:uncharacterized protein YigE (DUF2233 family)